MANRTGTYIAFDGLGQTDPTKSDFRYYATIKGWSAGKNIDFRFVDSHEKTNAVRDDSLRRTLESRIRERLSASKNVVVILSEDTRRAGSMLSYEIEKAVDLYELPLICVYPGYEIVMNAEALSGRWPDALTQRTTAGSASAIHIPFKMLPMLDAISQFSVNGKLPSTPYDYYSREAHIELGCKFD
ncbi:MAG: TIR domain-containing protein [Pseudomonadota bacterium]